jgi:hypothetical protein
MPPWDHEEIPTWECTTKGCNWEYREPFVREQNFVCGGCGKRAVRRRPSQVALADFVRVVEAMVEAKLTTSAEAATAYLSSLWRHAGYGR